MAAVSNAKSSTQQPHISPVFTCGVNDPISCVYLDTYDRFMAFGSVSGAVRLVFHNVSGDSSELERSVSEKKTELGEETSRDPKYSIIVLARRSEEAIHSLYVDKNDLLFATVGDKLVKVWNLNNLTYTKPLVSGAEAHMIEFTRAHNYMLCASSYTLQDGYCIIVCATGHQFLHYFSFEESDDEPRSKFEEETGLRFFQSKLAFAMPRNTYPCSFTQNLICWMDGSEKSKWKVSVWDWRRREKIWSRDYSVGKFGSVKPSGFRIQGSYLVSIHKGTQIQVHKYTEEDDGVVLTGHSKEVTAMYVGPSSDSDFPLIVTVGKDRRMIVWKQLQKTAQIRLPKHCSRFDLGIPYWIAASPSAREVYYTDDSGLHVVHL